MSFTYMYASGLQDTMFQYILEQELLYSKLNISEYSDGELIDELYRIDSMIRELRETCREIEEEGRISGRNMQFLADNIYG